mgnify:CR=1 FL=1
MPYTTDLFYLLGAPVFLSAYLYKITFKKKYRESSRGMLGRNLNGEPWGDSSDSDRLRLWLHAVSVGEVVAGKAVLSEWVKHQENSRIVASTVTETGQQNAKSLLSEAEEFTYYPLDISPIVKRFLDHYNPQVYIMMETEIWPNFLRMAAKRGVKIFLANGKLSDKSYKRWKKFYRFVPGAFESFTALCVQTERDKEKFLTFIKDPSRIKVTGNCKFDSSGEALSENERTEMLKRLHLAPKSRIIVAGSSHPGEEELILDAWEAVRKETPELKLILAPRHPDRFHESENMLRNRGLKYSLYTEPETENPNVVLVNTIGVLAKIYGLGEAAIVGGSFVNIGGHNLLEAAVHGIPVIYGPHMQNQPEIVRIFEDNPGGIQIPAGKLTSVLKRISMDEEERRSRGKAAAAAAAKNRGSAKLTVDFIRSFIEK